MRIIDADRLTELIEKIAPQSALELGYLYQIREYIKQMPTVEPQECSKNILDISDGITTIFEPQGLISSTSMTVIVEQKKNEVTHDKTN